jgi:hypothetical protein
MHTRSQSDSYLGSLMFSVLQSKPSKLSVLATVSDCGLLPPSNIDQTTAKAKKSMPSRGAWIEPPPVVELQVHDDDQTRSWLFSPYLSLVAELYRIDAHGKQISNPCVGSVVSSLSAAKLPNYPQSMYFSTCTGWAVVDNEQNVGFSSSPTSSRSSRWTRPAHTSSNLHSWICAESTCELLVW